MSTPTPLDEPFLRIAEVAARLQLNHRTVRREIREGRLAAVRVGAQIRVAPAALRAYLDANTVQPERVAS